MLCVEVGMKALNGDGGLEGAVEPLRRNSAVDQW